jgi:hypothetical protein
VGSIISKLLDIIDGIIDFWFGLIKPSERSIAIIIAGAFLIAAGYKAVGSFLISANDFVGSLTTALFLALGCIIPGLIVAKVILEAILNILEG